MHTDTLIVGGGLSGLYLAYRLAQTQHPFLLMEARDRLGGRILSQPAETGARFDLGPAWMWPDLQPLLRQLLTELGLTCFKQYSQGGMLYEDSQDGAPRIVHDPSAHGQSLRLRGGADYREPRTIDVHVRHLREKIEQDPSNPELILTIRGAGYRFRSE